jgi:hypothetical protein
MQFKLYQPPWQLRGKMVVVYSLAYAIAKPMPGAYRFCRGEAFGQIIYGFYSKIFRPNASPLLS